MTGRRDLVVIAALVVALAAGAIFEAAGPEASVEPRRRTPVAHTFDERASFCPPRIAGAKTSLAITSTAGESVPVGIEPVQSEEIELAPDRLLVHEVAGDSALSVVGFGASVAAGAVSAFADPVDGAGAAACTLEAAERWYFAAGSSALTADERLVVANPLPDEAVVRVSFLTPAGELARANLADVAVPAGESRAIEINKFVFRRRLLGAVVTAERGRVVAWRVLFATPHDAPPGVEFSLGTTAPSEVWYFPDGAVGKGLAERISLANPTDEEAVVAVTLVGPDGAVQPRRLSDVVVPPRAAHSVALPDSLPGTEGKPARVSAIVQSTNGVGIVAERTMHYDRDAIMGSAAEVGAPAPARSWVLGPAQMRPDADSVVLFNPGSVDARASISLFRQEGAPVLPEALQGITVAAGMRIVIPVGDFTDKQPTAARVDASAPIVAERFAYSEAAADVAAVMGVPITPSAR